MLWYIVRPFLADFQKDENENMVVIYFLFILIFTHVYTFIFASKPEQLLLLW